MSRQNSVLVSRTLYQIGIVTLIAALAWVGVGIYTALNNPTVVEIDKNALSPLTPNIDQKVIESISGRLKVVEVGLSVADDTIEVGQEDELTN